MQTFVKFVSKIDLKKVQNAKPRLELEIFFFLFFSLKLIPTLSSKTTKNADFFLAKGPALCAFSIS